MKTAISVPDEDFERFERTAARNGMSRSEFYRRAASAFADRLEGAHALTAVADNALARAGQPGGDGVWLAESERIMASGPDW